MSMDNLSLADIASVTRNDGDGFGGNMGFFWIFALLLLAGGGFGGFNGRNGGFNDAQANEILIGQRFDSLGNKLNAIGDGICDSTYALNNAINGAQGALGNAINGVAQNVANCCCETNRNIDGVRYDGAINTASINANTTEQTQKILDAITTNRMAEMQNKINALELQNALCGVVRYPISTAYNAGANPFCANTCAGYGF